jgi:hypothetical protein
MIEVPAFVEIEPAVSEAGGGTRSGGTAEQGGQEQDGHASMNTPQPHHGVALSSGRRCGPHPGRSAAEIPLCSVSGIRR